MKIRDSNAKQSFNWISRTSDWFGLVYRLLDSILLLVVLSYQNYWISYYITTYNSHNKSWYLIFVVDFAMTFLFTCGAFFAIRYYRKLHVLKQTNNLSKHSEMNENLREEHHIFKVKLPLWVGPLPLVWICWLLYVVVISTKIFILHLQDIAVKLFLSQTDEPVII